LNKAELIERVSKKTKMTKTQSEIILDAAIEVIQKSVSAGEEVKIVGFGTFDRASRKQRNGRNPKTGTTIVIPASRVPRFRPGKEFKTLVEPTAQAVAVQQQ
jgi:nucleoid DNA-binding protein